MEESNSSHDENAIADWTDDNVTSNLFAGLYFWISDSCHKSVPQLADLIKRHGGTNISFEAVKREYVNKNASGHHALFCISNDLLDTETQELYTIPWTICNSNWVTNCLKERTVTDIQSFSVVNDEDAELLLPAQPAVAIKADQRAEKDHYTPGPKSAKRRKREADTKATVDKSKATNLSSTKSPRPLVTSLTVDNTEKQQTPTANRNSNLSVKKSPKSDKRAATPKSSTKKLKSAVALRTRSRLTSVKTQGGGVKQVKLTQQQVQTSAASNPTSENRNSTKSVDHTNNKRELANSAQDKRYKKLVFELSGNTQLAKEVLGNDSVARRSYLALAWRKRDDKLLESVIELRETNRSDEYEKVCSILERTDSQCVQRWNWLQSSGAEVDK